MIDLHTHSKISDGTDTPAELVQKAHKLGLEALALTDHDTIAGLDEAEDAAADLGIDFVRGCEISVSTDQGEMHLLGLWVPKKCELLTNFLDRLRERRQQRNVAMIDRLRRHGVDITLDEIRNVAQGSIGRPHVAAILVQKGYAADREDAFSTWLGQGGKAYVPKPQQDPVAATRLLRGLGATVAIAHPLLRTAPKGWLAAFTGSLASAGLSCLEAWHSSHSPEQMRNIIDLAAKYKLGLTGGSDYHGANKPSISLGTGKNNNLHIDRDVLEKMKAMRKANGLPC